MHVRPWCSIWHTTNTRNFALPVTFGDTLRKSAWKILTGQSQFPNRGKVSQTSVNVCGPDGQRNIREQSAQWPHRSINRAGDEVIMSGNVWNMCKMYVFATTPRLQHLCVFHARVQGGAKKRGHPISLQIFWKFHDRIAWKLVNFWNIICWTQSLTFCLKISSRCGAT